MTQEENALKKIKKIYTTWGKVSQAGVDLCQFTDIMTVTVYLFPFKSAKIFMAT